MREITPDRRGIAGRRLRWKLKRLLEGSSGAFTLSNQPLEIFKSSVFVYPEDFRLFLLILIYFAGFANCIAILFIFVYKNVYKIINSLLLIKRYSNELVKQ